MVETKLQAYYQEIYDSLETGKYEDRSKFSLQVEDPVRFLENYSRVGRVKEWILNKVLVPKIELEKHEPVEEAVDNRIPLLINTGDKTAVIGGNQPVKLTDLEVALLDFVYDPKKAGKRFSLDELLISLHQAGGKGLDDTVRGTVKRIETNLGRKMFDRVPRGRTGWAALPDFKRVESIEEPIKQPPVITEPPILTLDPNTVVEYQIPANERRTDEETKILRVIIEGLTTHTRLYYEDLQRKLADLHSLETPHIYSARELRTKFDLGFRKLSKEYIIPLRWVKWTDEDTVMWTKIQDLINNMYEADNEKFLRSVRAHIDTAEREFRKRYPV